MKLNLGCGNDIREGYINCDLTNHKGVDKVVDITKKLSFKDNSIDEIICYEVLEHLVENPVDILEEFYRILKPNGLADIQVPYHRHPTALDCEHIRQFTIWSFFGIQNTKNTEFENAHGKMQFSYTWKTSNKILNSILKIKLFGKDVGRGLVQYVYLPFISHFFPFEHIGFKMIAIKA